MAYLLNVNQDYTHSEPTVREDLADDISIMDPVDTPLQVLLPRRTQTQPKGDWPVDSITRRMTVAQIATSARKDGMDAGFASAPGHRSRLHNITQINQREVDVTGTMQASEIAGVVTEFSHQLENETLGLGCEVEMALHWGKYSNAPVNQTTDPPRQMHGLIPWLAELGHADRLAAVPATRTLNNGATNAPVVPKAYFPYWYTPDDSDANTVLTTAILFDSVFTNAWRKGMRVHGCLGLMGSTIKTAINNLAFTGISANVREVPADIRAIYSNVDLLDTQWGQIWVVMDRYLDIVGDTQTIAAARAPTGGTLTIGTEKAAVFIEPSYFQIGELRRRHYEPLAKVGDSIKGQIIGELTLRVRNPRAGTGMSNIIK